MEYFSVIKGPILLMDTTVWVDLKNIILNGRTQMLNTTQFMTPFIVQNV